MTTGDLSGQISTAYTVEAWVYPTQLTGGGLDQSNYGFTVMSSSVIAANGYPLWITLAGSEVRVWSFEGTATAYHQTVGAGIAINTWTHIALSSTKSGVTTLYVNGTNVLSYTNDGDVNWSTILTIGALRPSRPTSNIPFIGLMDEVRVWNDIRTPQEIQDNMINEINVADPVAKQNLVGYWSFNDATDPTEDLSDNNNNGDLIQGATFGVQNPNVAPPITLPVELSSFTAVTTAEHFVGLHWVTQSETNVAGYYVYRNTEDSIDEAIRVSPFIPAFNLSTQSNYSYVDEEVVPNTRYYFWLQNIDLTGDVSLHGPVTVLVGNNGSVDIPTIPSVDGLQSIYPNPFNPSTTISYSLTKATVVEISVFNSRGQLVRSFNEGEKAPGVWTVQWNGMDNSGNACTTGVYYIRMLAGEYSYLRKAMMIK
jgi:hypothetical protein